MHLLGLPLRCLSTIVSALEPDWKAILSLRLTSKKFNIPELEPPTLKKIRVHPLKILLFLQEVKDTVLKHTSTMTRKKCEESLAKAEMRVEYIIKGETTEISRIVIEWRDGFSMIDRSRVETVPKELRKTYGKIFHIQYSKDYNYVRHSHLEKVVAVSWKEESKN
jgi:hypothetical protein